MSSSQNKARHSRLSTEGFESGVLRIEEMFRKYPPADRRITHSPNLVMPELLAKPVFDPTQDVRWFDQVPTDDLMRACGHA